MDKKILLGNSVNISHPSLLLPVFLDDNNFKTVEYIFFTILWRTDNVQDPAVIYLKRGGLDKP